MDCKQSNHQGGGYISSDDGFSSLVEKALLAEMEDNVSCDNVASKIECIVAGAVCEQIDPSPSR